MVCHPRAMSVQRYTTEQGPRYRVRWREGNGRMRSRTFTTQRDANALDVDISTRRLRGEPLPRAGRETLATAYAEWWRLRGSLLAANTQRTYQSVWNAHIRGQWDHYRLNELAADPQLLEELTAALRAKGVGPAAQRKTLVVLSSVFAA